MSHIWLHTPDCKVLNEMKNVYVLHPRFTINHDLLFFINSIVTWTQRAGLSRQLKRFKTRVCSVGTACCDIWLSVAFCWACNCPAHYLRFTTPAVQFPLLGPKVLNQAYQQKQ